MRKARRRCAAPNRVRIRLCEYTATARIYIVHLFVMKLIEPIKHSRFNCEQILF